MEFLVDNKLKTPTSDNTDTEFPARNMLVRRLASKYKSETISKGDSLKISFESEDWDGFSDAITEEIETGLNNRYKLNETDGATASDAIGTDDLTITQGGWESAGDTNSRWLTGGDASTALPSHIQSLVTRSEKCWWLKDQVGFYTFEREDGTDNNYAQNDLTDNGTITYGAGPHGNFAATYDGSTGYHSAPAWFAPGTGNFSFECWFRINIASANTMLIFDQRDSTITGLATSRIVVYFSAVLAGLIRVDLTDGTTPLVTLEPLGKTTYNDNTWHHLELTVNRAEGVLHGSIDGDNSNDAEVDISSMAGSISAAGTFFLGDQYEGSLANVRIIEAALSADDNAELFAIECKGDLDEVTRVQGDLSETQSAAFHGGIENLLHDQQDVAAWATQTNVTPSYENLNYKGYPVYGETATAASGLILQHTAVAISDTSAFFSMVMEASQGAYIYFRDTTAGANRGTIQITANANAADTFDAAGYEDLGDGTYLLWGIVSGLTSGNSHAIKITNDASYWISAKQYFGLPLISPGAQRIPFNTNSSASAARNITGIEFYPRNGMIGEGVFRNDAADSDYTGRIFWSNNNAGSTTPAIYGFVQGATDIVKFRLRDSAATVASFEATIPTTYRHEFLRWVVNYDTTSQTSGSCTIYYGYDPDAKTYADSVTVNWTADPSAYDWSAIASFEMGIGSHQDGSGQFIGPILYTKWSHPDDPIYRYTLELNPYDYVEALDAFDCAPWVRQVYMWDEFKTEEALEKLEEFPEGVDNESDRFALLSHAFNGRDTVKLKASTGIHPIEIEELIINDDIYYLQLASTIARFTSAEIEVTAGREKVFEIGWVFLGKSLTLPSPDFGSMPTFDDNDGEIRTAGGQVYRSRGVYLRQQSFNLSGVEEDDYQAIIDFWKSDIRGEAGLLVQFEDSIEDFEPYFATIVYNQNGRTRSFLYPYSLTFKEAR